MDEDGLVRLNCLFDELNTLGEVMNNLSLYQVVDHNPFVEKVVWVEILKLASNIQHSLDPELVQTLGIRCSSLSSNINIIKNVI